QLRHLRAGLYDNARHFVTENQGEVRAEFLGKFAVEDQRIGWIHTAPDDTNENFVFLRLRNRNVLKLQYFRPAVLVGYDRFHGFRQRLRENDPGNQQKAVERDRPDHSLDSGTAFSAALKPILECVPSQNGFSVDAPQRQSAIRGSTGNLLPSASTNSTSPFTM